MGKKILILGGTSASVDVVKQAKAMGVYVIVTDDAPIENGAAKIYADEVLQISTTDHEELVSYIEANDINGVFCGPSEFNIQNCLIVAEKANLPFYCTQELWDICSNKSKFKSMCLKHGIPTVPEYNVSLDNLEDDLSEIDYPVVIKPTDSSGSRGLTVCNNKKEAIAAYKFALEKSKCKEVLVEEYIANDGLVFSFRYILDEGKYYPYLTFDTYVVDPEDGNRLISGFSYFPSNFTGRFLKEIDSNVRTMFSDIGMMNGTAFIQALPSKGKIYCNEMGYRLSGGFTYKISEPLFGINDIRMMLRYALGGKIATQNEVSSINLERKDIVMAQLMIPLEPGAIYSISGLETIMENEGVIDFLQYYSEGDCIQYEAVGTLSQHFGRFTLCAERKDDMIALVNFIQENLLIQNNEGEDMYKLKFDVDRLENIGY